MNSSTESVYSLPFTWRVSRYNPNLRYERGSYTIDTWTSVSDIGKEFDGHVLERHGYEAVESAYVAAFFAFAKEADVGQLEVRHLEYSGKDLGEGAILSLSRSAEVVRALLREEVVCGLESPNDDFFVHVGFDLYMYVGAAQPCPIAVGRARALGLHVDEGWPSPQGS